jgi:hypothetical protein
MSNRPRVLLTLSAYATEGGLDGPYQPATCYSPTIALGRHSGPGEGEGLWRNYEAVLDVAGEIGLEGVCLEVSWARLEPRRGRRDTEALSRYIDVVAHARRRGLWVSIAAIDAAWPAWLGLEAWLMPWVVPVATEYAQWLSSSLEADALCVFSDRDILTRGFVADDAAPPWRRGAHDDAASAAENLERIESIVRQGAVTPGVSSANIELDDLDDVQSLHVDEVHVRSLVRGAGPLASARGLLARRGDRWVVVDSDVAHALSRAT